MACACGVCGKLYNFEERPARIGNFNSRTNVMFFIRRDGAGRPYLNDIQACPECADKVYKYIQTMNSGADTPEFIFSEHAS